MWLASETKRVSRSSLGTTKVSLGQPDGDHGPAGPGEASAVGAGEALRSQWKRDRASSREDRSRQAAMSVAESAARLDEALVTWAGRQMQADPEIEPARPQRMPLCGRRSRETGLSVRATGIIGSRIRPVTGVPIVYVAAEPVSEDESGIGIARVDSGGDLTRVRWVSLAEAGRLIAGMFGLVHEYLQRCSEPSLRSRDGVDRREPART